MYTKKRRVYSLEEVVYHWCASDASWRGEAKKAECRAALLARYSYIPTWELRRVRLSQLWHDPAADSQHNDKTRRYIEHLIAGREAPAVVVVRSTKFPGKLVVFDGHHRVAAAKAVGDKTIAAFVETEASWRKRAATRARKRT